jgi:translocation protein SEC62
MMLPLWPKFAIKCLWYVVFTVLLITVVGLLFRLLIFVLFFIVGIEFCIFPRLFDKNLSLMDSFKPLYIYEHGARGQWGYRLGLIVCIAAVCYGAYKIHN